MQQRAVLAPAADETATTERRKPYRVQEVADELDVNRSTVYRAVAVGTLEAERIGTGRGTLRIPVEAFNRYRSLIRVAATSPQVAA